MTRKDERRIEPPAEAEPDDVELRRLPAQCGEQRGTHSVRVLRLRAPHEIDADVEVAPRLDVFLLQGHPGAARHDIDAGQERQLRIGIVRAYRIQHRLGVPARRNVSDREQRLVLTGERDATARARVVDRARAPAVAGQYQLPVAIVPQRNGELTAELGEAVDSMLLEEFPDQCALGDGFARRRSKRSRRWRAQSRCRGRHRRQRSRPDHRNYA
jgi:hypothetical protein